MPAARLAPLLGLLGLLACFAGAGTARAQRIVVSPAPEAVSVTVYRNPRAGDMNLDWLEGYALISETRTIRLPAGDSVIRFEGVAGGILPVSAIVTGLPGGVGEKNRDARLLSPGTLVDAALGRRVHIRRTSEETGRVTETEAVIRSGPDGVVLQTPAGFEALRCTGLPETLVYDRVPEGLSDKPTLAVTTRAPTETTATVRLSYLARGFDWRANYVARVAPGGRTLDLFAWLTLANGNEESFPDASTQAVAGKPNKEEDGDEDIEPESSGIELRCWPGGTTSDIPLRTIPLGGSLGRYPMGDELVVTGSRVANPNLTSSSPITVMNAEQMMARQEELGDLKLYRIPEPVTVAAHSQKQVAFLSRKAVPFRRLYSAYLPAGELFGESRRAGILMRMKNEKARGLGLPLPSGMVAVFETVDGRSMLAGEAALMDKAIGEEVEIWVGDSPQVQFSQREIGPQPSPKAGIGNRPPRRYELQVTNANPDPITIEVSIAERSDGPILKSSRKLGVKGGNKLWTTTVPANGRATLTYTTPPPPLQAQE
jgi:hypothetical protein